MKSLKIMSWLLAIIILFQVYPSIAQVHALKIGDQMPDLEYLDAYNYKTRQNEPVKFSQLKGKLVILDFWGIFCIPCIKDFPKLDSLQQRFHDRIQIISVNSQSKDSVSRFFKNHSVVYRPSLPFITGDKVLDKLFPHTGVPFQVWIDKNGKILHLADSYYLTPENIDKTITNQQVNMRVAPMNVYPKTLFDDQWKDLVVFSSYLSHGSDEKGLHVESPANGKCITEGGTILKLYQRAYDGLTNHQYSLYSPGRVVLEVKDSTKFITQARGEAHREWLKRNFFWYQLMTPVSYHGNIYELMREDLQRYFNLKASIQKRMVKCLVLVRTSKEDKLGTKGGAEKYNFYEVDGRSSDTSLTRGIINKPYSELSGRIKGYVELWHQAFQDSTGYSGKVDFTVSRDVLAHLDLRTLQAELQRYDLDLIEKNCLLDVLILKDPE